MAKDKKFLGGYVTPELYYYFDDQANQHGLSKNAFLEVLLTAHEAEGHDLEEKLLLNKEFNLSDYFESDFSQELNDLFITAGDGFEDATQFFNVLSPLLESAVDMPLIIDTDEDVLKYEEVLTDEISQLITDFITENYHDLPDESSREELLRSLATTANERATTLAARDRELSISFSAEEWGGMQKFLANHKVNTDLPTYLRHVLGKKLRDKATGFLGVADEEMWAVGDGMVG